MEKKWLFFAPRSGEKSRENFQATLASGYPKETVLPFLEEEEIEYLKGRDKFYIWGNEKAREGSWKKMNIGDYVAFYAKGTFIYVGKCILKKHSPELARGLWDNVPKKNLTWEYVYFLDELKPIKIPLEVIKELAGYKEKMVVQGFQSINPEGMERIIYLYGSLESFLDSFSEGIKYEDFVKLNKISDKETINPEDLEVMDEIFRYKNFDLALKDFEQRYKDKKPELVTKRINVIKRNQALIKKMKDKYGNKCQVCGFTFKKRSGGNYSELAHIKNISSRDPGVDSPSNVIVLCPNHHKMLDFGNLKIISRTEYSIDNKKHDLFSPLFIDLKIN